MAVNCIFDHRQVSIFPWRWLGRSTFGVPGCLDFKQLEALLDRLNRGYIGNRQFRDSLVNCCWRRFDCWGDGRGWFRSLRGNLCWSGRTRCRLESFHQFPDRLRHFWLRGRFRLLLCCRPFPRYLWYVGCWCTRRNVREASLERFLHLGRRQGVGWCRSLLRPLEWGDFA